MSENKIEQLERKVKNLEYIIIFIIFIITILTIILIGEYTGLWGGVMVHDENLGLDILYIKNLMFKI